MRLRTILTAVFCLCALAPMLFYWFWPNNHILELEKNYAGVYQEAIAGSVASELAFHHEELEKIFVSTSSVVLEESETLSFGDLGMVQELIHACKVNRDTGKLVGGYASNWQAVGCPKTLPQDLADKFSDALEKSDGELVTTPVVKLRDNAPAIYMVTADKDHFFFAAISLEEAIDTGSRFSFGESGRTLIVDSTGTVISHPGPEMQSSNRNLGELNLVQLAIAGGTGTGTYFSGYFGMEMLAGYAHVPGINWVVIVFQPVAVLEKRVGSLKHESLFALGAGLVFAIGLAFFAARFMTFPIVQMVRTMERIGNGELRAYEDIKSGLFQPREFGKARDGIRAMADKLQENIDTISKHAYLDGITGLPNRECFKVLAQQEIEKLAGTGRSGALLFLDLDGFKQVNDVYGHRSGDDLLKGFGERLHLYCGNEMKRRAAGADNAVSILPARLGGDEFVVFLSNTRSEAVLHEFANGLFQRVFGNFRLHNGISLDVKGSVGGACYPEHARDFDELLRLADIAMYQAKKSGKGKFCLHSNLAEMAQGSSNDFYESEGNQAG